jgi:hypothetical protein
MPASVRRAFVTPVMLAILIAAAALPASALAAPTWLAPTILSAGGGEADDPQVAVDPEGEAVVVWEHYDGSDWIIQAAARPPGGTWRAPIDLSVAGQNADEPRVALDANGDAVAVWERDDGTEEIVQAATRPAGGTWGAPVDLSAAGESAKEARVALDANGDAVAVWERDDGTEEIVQAATRAAGGSWEAPIDLSAAGESAHDPHVAVDPAGDAIAVWRRNDGSDFIVETATRPAGGMWQPPIDLSAAGQSAYDPEVAYSPTGEAAVVWRRDDGTAYRVQATARTVGGTWGTPIDLSAAGQNAYRPQVVLDPAGEAVVVWERYDGIDWIAQGDARPAGGTWGAPVDLSATGADVYRPQIAADTSGDAVAVWEYDTSSEDVIQAAVHDAAGPRLPDLSIPATGSVGVPLSFSVSPLDVWSALDATDWSFGDGTGAAGTAVSHAYAAPGTYSVTVTGADALGNASTASGTVRVAAAPPPGSRTGRARAGRLVRVKGRVALLALSCGSAARCAGAARISVPAKAHAKTRRRAAGASSTRRARRITIGAASVRLAAGRHRTVKVPLTKRGRALLGARRHGGLKARLTGSGVISRAVVLKAVGHRRRH